MASPKLSPSASPMLGPSLPPGVVTPLASPMRSPMGSPVPAGRSPAGLIGGGSRRRMGGRHALVVAAEATAPTVFALVSEQWGRDPSDAHRALLIRLMARWLPFCSQGAHNFV